MRLRRISRVLAAVSIMAAIAGIGRDARAGDTAAAREQVKLGYQLAQDGKCDEAIPHFLESIKLDVKAVTLINLASCEEKTSRLADALGHWVDARSRAQAEGNAPIEEEAEKRAKALEPRLPKLTVVVAGATADTEVTRDGVVLGAASMGVALPVNPGAHTLVAHAKGYEDTSAIVSLAEGETKQVELKLGAPKKDPPIAKRPTEPEGNGLGPLVFVGYGVALVGVGVGTVTGLMAFGKARTAEDACPGDRCTTAGMDAVDTGRTFATISTVSFIVGAAGAAVGTYALMFGGKTKTSASVAVDVGPTGGGLRGSF